MRLGLSLTALGFALGILFSAVVMLFSSPERTRVIYRERPPIEQGATLVSVERHFHFGRYKLAGHPGQQMTGYTWTGPGWRIDFGYQDKRIARLPGHPLN